MKIGSLFSGIGGLELGLTRAGLGEVVWQAENAPFCRQVLRQRFPGVRLFGSVQEVKRGQAESVDLLCGGYPCQPFSHAGRRAGADDPRHLWPECARIIGDLDPEWCVFENVEGHRTKGLREVLGDLAALGRDAEWFNLRASDVGAPHRRARLFIVAHRSGATLDRFRGCLERSVAESRRLAMLADAERRELQRRRGAIDLARQASQPRDQERGSNEDIASDRHRGEAVAVAVGHRRERECSLRVHGDGAQRDDAERCDPSVGVGQSDAHRERGEAGAISGPPRAPERTDDERDRSRVEPAFPPRPFDAAGWADWIARGGPEPVVRGSVDGVPDRLDRVGALGNAVVPLVAETVGRAILAAL